MCSIVVGKNTVGRFTSVLKCGKSTVWEYGSIWEEQRSCEVQQQSSEDAPTPPFTVFGSNSNAEAEADVGGNAH